MQFTIDKESYSAGDTIVIKNNSTNVFACAWTFTGPDGANVPNLPYSAGYKGNMLSYANPPLKLSVSARDGMYTLTLTGYNAVGKTGTASKTFPVTTTRATVKIYTQQPSHGIINFYGDREYVGSVYMAPTSYIVTVTTTLPIGKRIIEYSLYSSQYTRAIDVKDGQVNEVHF